MSNGKSSSLFLTREQSDKNLEEVELDVQAIKKLRGTSNSYWLSQVHFHDRENNELKRMASY
jgi:hypothetical protein